MRIIFITNTIELGAGIAINRMFETVKSSGIETILIQKKDLDIEELPYSKNKFSLFLDSIYLYFSRVYFRIFTKNNNKAYCYFTYNELDTIKIHKIDSLFKDGDIVIFGWIAQMLNSQNIKEIVSSKKIQAYWFAMDMAPITGGCHYFWQCNGYIHNCHICPADYESYLAYKQLKSKKRNISKIKIGLLASSNIGIEKFKKASIQFSSYYNIPYPINTTIFNFKENKKNKKNKTIFFNAQYIEDKRKGFSFLIEIINYLDKIVDNKTTVDFLTVYYNEHKPYFEKYNHCRLVDCGLPASNDSELASLYNEADIFICTSIEDLSPMMVNEALLCGLPVLAFNNASNKEYIINMKNGFMANEFDTKTLSNTLLEFIKDELKFDSQNDIRQSVYNLHESTSWINNFKKKLQVC